MTLLQMFPFFKHQNEELQNLLAAIVEDANEHREDVKQMARALKGQLFNKIETCVAETNPGPRGKLLHSVVKSVLHHCYLSVAVKVFVINCVYSTYPSVSSVFAIVLAHQAARSHVRNTLCKCGCRSLVTGFS